ncbi:MAG: hypothetical protein U9Q19_02590 [Pseudomonadota bacterium]|nr:hypothetical protein [Pseudomonadota bacterium]
MGARLDIEQEQMLLDMYQHRINLRIEADEYTIIKIAEKLGCSMNTVWARTRGLDWQRTDSQYVPKLEAQVEDMRGKFEVMKNALFRILDIQREVRRVIADGHTSELQRLASLQARTHTLIDTINKELTA